jgi:predicted NAD/FAD-binding protein
VINKIAIIGTGISGLTAAYLLNKKYDITVFEQNDYIGGHTHTVNVKTNSGNYAVDTGFIVFNDRTYPNFIRLLEQLNVEKQNSNMSFSFSSEKNSMEYSGDTLSSLFAQRKNLISPQFYRLLYDIFAFNRRAKTFLKNKQNMTLEEFIQKNRYGNLFIHSYLNPLASAIWSAPLSSIGNIPAEFILDFYQHHGLLDVVNRPQWYTVKGGSSAYITPMISSFKNKIHLSANVENIKRNDDHVLIEVNGKELEFDAVVIACHSDEAMSLLSDPSELETKILGSIPYNKNSVILHTDTNALPKSKKAWASWNYIDTKQEKASLTYYMNKLQNIQSSECFCVSVNNTSIDKDKIIETFTYTHPSYNEDSVMAKSRHLEINGQRKTFYVGAYWGNGFHEDGVISSIKALEPLGVSL